MMASASIKITKKCAFCKYWYDPCNMYIEPRKGAPNIWWYDSSAKCKCLKKNLVVASFSNCRDYICKIPIS